MELNEIRKAYFQYMKSQGHTLIPSALIVPQNDPTTLFTGSGMQPLVPYLLGQPHPQGNKLVNAQKSFRAEDIEEVGDNRHTTFFEMLGNWSLGDYFKEQQLNFFFTFLTEKVKLDPNKLYVTTFIGDDKNNIPKDTESGEIWKRLFAAKGITAELKDIGSEEDGARLGMGDARIFYYNAKKNWWSRAGVPENMPVGEPGGPDSEVFYDFGLPHDPKFGKECHPNCDCGRFMEIGNSVFMQYIKSPDGTFALLPKQNVDFGGGLERIAAAALNDPDVFRISALWPIMGLLEKVSDKKYDDARYTKSFRIVGDHVRAAVIMLGDGVRPSNTESGYVLRRLLRRAAQHALKLGATSTQGESILVTAAKHYIDSYSSAYSELAGDEAFATITNEIHKEEMQFARTLETGMKELEKMAAKGNLTGEEAFILFTTFGFPFEMTKEIAVERGIRFDDVAEKDFIKRMVAHSDLSRAGSEQKFKGGLADASVETTRLHTAHHLLLKALQIVLGDHVKQRGSNITAARLRIDFAHGAKMTPEEKARVEQIVNEKMHEGLPVLLSPMPKEQAETLNAQHEFGAKYPDMVNVYSMGPKAATLEIPQFENAFSIEFCGGPHVQNTADLLESGDFKIIAEEASSAGIRRIKAVFKK